MMAKLDALGESMNTGYGWSSLLLVLLVLCKCMYRPASVCVDLLVYV